MSDLTLAAALGLAPGEVAALVGGGGKTTALYRLLDEVAAEGGRALATTTTRMSPPPPGGVDALIEAPDLETARRALAALPASAARVLVVQARTAEGKVMGVPPAWVGPLEEALPGRRLTLVEADGSAGRPLKGAAPYEPVIPPSTDCLVPVAGADGIGAPLSPEVVHRPERFAEQAALALGRPLAAGEAIPAEAVAGVLLHPRGLLRRLPAGARVVPLVTRLGSERHAPDARALAAALLARGARRVVLGDLGGSLGVPGPLSLVEAPPSRVTGVVLAAGRGERMGEGPPKLLRLLAGRPLLEHVLLAALASGLHEVVVVLGHAAGAVRPLVEAAGSRAAPGRLRAVVNPRHADGQGTSVAAGAAAVAPDATGVLFLLADQPLVRAPLVDRLLAEQATAPDRVLVPACEGRRGNPVLFPTDLLSALAALSGERGGRAVLDRVPGRVRVVETGDPGVLADVDTAGDLRRLDDDVSRR